MILRALAPAGVPFTLRDIAYAILAAIRGQESLAAFRREISAFCGLDSVFLYSSGRGALCIGLQALRMLHPEKDEVLIPAFTSFSVPSAIVNAGLKLSLYDIDPKTLSPELESLKNAMNERTLCVIVCHLYGYPADMEPIIDILKARGIPLIDDAAQAMGARYKGRQIGTFGDLGLYSLSRGKNISAVDGGILVTRDRRLAEVIASLPQKSPSLLDQIKVWIIAMVLCFLLHPRLYWIPRKLPFLKLGESRFDPDFMVTGLTPFQAGLGIRMLKRLDNINAGRSAVAKTWTDTLKNRGVPRLVKGGEPVWLRVPVLDGAAWVQPELGVVATYPSSLDAIAELKPSIVNHGRYPGAERLAQTMVTLPTHCYVSHEDIETVTNAMTASGDG